MKTFKLEIISCILATILFAFTAVLVFATPSPGVDNAVFSFVSAWRNDFTIAFFTYFTHIAGKVVTIALVVILAFIFINRNKSTYMQYVKNERWNNFLNLITPWLIFALSVLFVTILFFVFKGIFARHRPVDWFIIDETGYSFPSGHTATAVVMYGVIALLIHYSFDKKWIKVLTWSLFAIITAMIGVSRIFLGVHYFTDVLGGLFLGFIVLAIASACIKLTATKICLTKDSTIKKV